MSLLLALIILLAVTWFTGPGLDRSPALHRYLSFVMVGIGGVMAFQQDWIVLALWLCVCVNALRFPWPMNQLLKMATAGVLYLLVLTVRQHISTDLVPYVLVGIVAVAVAQGSLYFVHRRWSGNPNHTDMLMGMAVACCLSLGMLKHWSWVLGVPLFLSPMLSRRSTQWGQLTIWTGAAGLSVGLLFYPGWFVPIILASACGLLMVSWSYRLTIHQHDSGRLRIWWVLLTFWWKSGWKARLIGLGPDSWRSYADSFSQLEQQKTGKAGTGSFMTHPHNEYVHVVFEHGAIGLMLLLAWIGSLVWHTWEVQPALLIPALTLCAIAFTCFPWTLPYEVGVQRNGRIEYDPFGCVGMVVVTMVFVAFLSV